MINVFVRSLAKIFSSRKRRKPRTYNYTKLTRGQDYFFESIEEGTKGYLTKQGQKVQPGDYIILREENNTFRYKIEEIDYYSNPSDMWIALLKKETLAEDK
jgi:hypothetical protein